MLSNLAVPITICFPLALLCSPGACPSPCCALPTDGQVLQDNVKLIDIISALKSNLDPVHFSGAGPLRTLQLHAKTGLNPAQSLATTDCKDPTWVHM